MRTPIFSALLAAVMASCAGAVGAQSAAPSTGQPAAPTAPAARLAPIDAPQSSAPSSSNQLIERIHVESRDVLIEELRVGGETRSISVAPKGGWPSYDVQPTTGERSWKVLGF